MTLKLTNNKNAKSSVLLFLFILFLFLLTTAILTFLLISPLDSTTKKEITNPNYNALEETVFFTPAKSIIDTDDDGIEDIQDNCPLHFNPFQEDKDKDEKGDACDISKTSRNNDDKTECTTNTDCGADALTGNLFCQSDDVYQNYKIYNCSNAGKTSSSCSSSISAQLIQDCNFGCSSGICIVPNCSTNADCNDNNSYTEDICKNPNTPQSFCENNPIVCLTNIDCGINSLIGNLFCSIDNLSVLQLFQSWTCLFPGTAQSSCSSSTSSQIQQTCSDICVNGICQNIECYNYAGCGTNSLTGNLFCQSDEVYQNYQTNICNLPGTILSSCSSSTAPQLIQDCADTCVAGICVDIECSTNADCDDNNSSTADICHNPAAPQSYCSNELIPECTAGQTRTCGTDIGVCQIGLQTCNNQGFWNSQCIGEITPSAEICDTIDNDCDNSIDETFTNLGQTCYSGTGQCQRAGNFICSANYLTTICNVSPGTPSAEICDTLDNDCDGSTDEGVCQPPPIPVCSNECPSSGTFQCAGAGYKVCGNFDADSCLEWSGITSCGYGKTCRGGICVFS